MCRWFVTLRTTIYFNWWPKHQQNQGNGAWKSSNNNSRTYGHGWNFIWTSANNFEGSFVPQKSQIALGVEISQFLRKRASLSSMWSNAFWLSKRQQTNYCWRWILDLCLRSRNNWPIMWISFKRWGQTKNTSPKSFENQADADSFLWLSWCCALRISSNWLNYQQGILFKRYASLAWSFSQKKKKRLELWANNSWILHHDNAPSPWFLVSFSPKTRSILLHNHRIHLT